MQHARNTSRAGRSMLVRIRTTVRLLRSTQAIRRCPVWCYAVRWQFGWQKARLSIQRLTLTPPARQLADRLKDRWGGNSDRREVTMRLFMSAVLIIMLSAVGWPSALAMPRTVSPAL